MRFFWIILGFAAALASAGAGQLPGLILNDLDGIARQPLDPGDRVASVLIFYGPDCPISNSYAPEINRIVLSQTNFAFYLVPVDADLSPSAAKEHARQFDLRPPILLDREHRLVKLTGVTVTPEAVVIGKDGRTLYRGRIDNLYAGLGKRRVTASRQDLREALAAIGAGKAVKQKETKAIGCLIQ